MGKRITADMLTGFGSVIRCGFETLYPNGLTMEELAGSDQQWLRIIYQHFQEVSNGNDHH